MSLNRTIQAGVDSAFKAVGDKTVKATLTNREPVDYDYATNQPVFSEESSKVVDCIFLKKYSEDDAPANVVKAEVLFKSYEVPEVDIYDSVMVDGVRWNLIPPFEDNGATVRARLSRST